MCRRSHSHSQSRRHRRRSCRRTSSHHHHRHQRPFVVDSLLERSRRTRDSIHSPLSLPKITPCRSSVCSTSLASSSSRPVSVTPDCQCSCSAVDGHLRLLSHSLVRSLTPNSLPATVVCLPLYEQSAATATAAAVQLALIQRQQQLFSYRPHHHHHRHQLHPLLGNHSLNRSVFSIDVELSDYSSCCCCQHLKRSRRE